MIEILEQLGYVEYPRFSSGDWTCYKHVKGWMWCFVDKTNTIIKAEIEDHITVSIEDVKYMTKRIHG